MAAHSQTAELPVDTAARAVAARQWFVRVATAGLTFWLAYENGSYAEPTRYAITIAVWWGVIVAVAIGLAKTSRSIGSTAAVASALAVFAAWTLASTAWADDAASAFTEFDRVSLYLGVFTLCSVLFRRRDLAAWCDGIGFGIAAIALLALISRLFPGAIARASGASLLPVLTSRLSYPVGYWNGLGIFCAMGLPLLLMTATTSRPRALRATAAGAIPLLGAVMYLTSSRGAVATAIAGVSCFVLLTPRRWLTLGTLLATGTGAGIAIAVLARQPDVANGISGSSTVAIAVFVVALATAVVFAALLTLPQPRYRPPAAAGWGVAAALVLVITAVVIAAHPVRRFDAFKEPPIALTFAHGDYVKAHLLSGSGNGRWQFWESAVDELGTSRFHGRGAGSYGDWWTAHGALALSVHDAHSLYLETLGELGIVGLILLLLPFAVAARALSTSFRRLDTDARAAIAALTALGCAYLLAAGIDWMWELTAISLVAFAALAVAVAACASDAAPTSRAPRRPSFVAVGAATLVTAWFALCAAALPLLTHIEIGASQAAARQGKTVAALGAARSAINLQPWAAEPYLQLALVAEQAGRLRVADNAIRRAIARAPDDWHLWLTATRIQTKSGRIAAARQSLRRARSLNPRSPIFSPGGISLPSGRRVP